MNPTALKLVVGVLSVLVVLGKMLIAGQPVDLMQLVAELVPYVSGFAVGGVTLKRAEDISPKMLAQAVADEAAGKPVPPVPGA